LCSYSSKAYILVSSTEDKAGDDFSWRQSHQRISW